MGQTLAVLRETPDDRIGDSNAVDTESVVHEDRDMRNVTVSLEDEIALWARVQAAEHDMSLSRFLAELLRKEKERDSSYEEAMHAFLARPRTRLRDDPSVPYPTREELYDRTGLR